MKPYYGIDAPKVIFYLLLAGSFLCLFSLFFPFKVICLISFVTGCFCFFEVLWMLFSSLKGKRLTLEKATRSLNFDEIKTVLDIGCGLGLFTSIIAKKLKEGSVIGIDIFQKKDLSSNSLTKACLNLSLEKLDQKTSILEKNICDCDLKAGSFDYITSSLVLHNISHLNKALEAIDYLLKKGGQVVIIDFQIIQTTARFFKNKGYDVKISGFQYATFPFTKILTATKL